MSAPFSVAVLSPTPTWPNDFGNRKRVRRVCEGLRDHGARVDFFLYALEDDWRGRYPRHALEEMRAHWNDVHVIIPSVPYHPSSQEEDHRIDEWWDPAIDTYLGWYLRARRPDALLVNYAYLSKALELAPSGCLRVLDTHDRMGGRRQVLQELGLQPEFFHTTPEEEAKALDRADLVLAIKEEEADYFGSISRTPVLPVQYVESSHPVEPEADPDGYLRVGLFGARNNVNVSNVSRFLDAALPMFSETMAPIKVVLAGSMCQDLDRFRSDQRVSSLGFVDDVSEFYGAVDVAVVPVETSTGQKIRVGEALGYGVPVIAHGHAFEGYPSGHRFHRLDDMDSVARACVAVSFERSMLADLSAATQASQSIAVRREREAVSVLAGAIQQHIPVSYFLVPYDRLQEEPELRLHLGSMVVLAASYSRVRIVITDAVPTDSPSRELERLVGFIRHFGSVLVDDSEAESAGFPCDGHVEDLALVLGAPEAASVWCYDDALSELLTTIECEVLIADGFTQLDGLDERPQGFVSGIEGRILSGRAQRRAGLDGGARLERAEAFNVATFSPWATAELPEMRDVLSDGRAMVFADPADQPLAWVVLAALRHEGLGAILVVPDGTEPAITEDIERAWAGWVPEVLQASDARRWLRLNAPAVTFDCAPLSPGMSVPTAMTRLHAHRGRGSVPWKAWSVPATHGLPAVIGAVRDHIAGILPPERDEDGSVQFYNRQSGRFIPQAIRLPSR